jgi:hypothetical protein
MKKQLKFQECDEDNMKNDLTKAVFGNTLFKTATLSEHLQMLNDMNLLNIGELAEIAISKTSKVDRCAINQEGYDLINGLEIKHAQTHERSAKGNTMSAWISIKNKTGDILAVVSESKTKKQYFFNLPYNYYKSFNANATYSIHHNLNTSAIIFNFWDETTGDTIIASVRKTSLNTIDVMTTATFSNGRVVVMS